MNAIAGSAARVARSIVLGLPLLAFVHMTATDTAQSEAIFKRAVAVAESDAHAPYATYDVVVSFTNGGRRIVDTWPTTEDLSHAAVLASAFTKEERDAPTAPHGINIVARRRVALAVPKSFGGDDPAAAGSIRSAPVNPERTGDPVGPVALAIDQNFGLTPPRAYVVAHDASTIAGVAGNLTTIGQTGTSVERYHVALLETDGSIAHLGLTPLRDGYHNRLRELWVDIRAGYVQEAIVQGVGDRAPFDRIRWDVDFRRQDGGSYVASEQALDPISIDGSLEHLQITFQNLALLSYSPLKYTFGIETPVRTLHDP